MSLQYTIAHFDKATQIRMQCLKHQTNTRPRDNKRIPVTCVQTITNLPPKPNTHTRPTADTADRLNAHCFGHSCRHRHPAAAARSSRGLPRRNTSAAFFLSERVRANEYVQQTNADAVDRHGIIFSTPSFELTRHTVNELTNQQIKYLNKTKKTKQPQVLSNSVMTPPHPVTHTPNRRRGGPTTHIVLGILLSAGFQQQLHTVRVTTHGGTNQRRASALHAHLTNVSLAAAAKR